MRTRLPNFSGKVVSLSTGSDNTLEVGNPIFKRLGHRLFVTGTIPSGATTSDWGKGLPCAVAWDAVTDYLVYESEAQFFKIVGKDRLRKRKK